MESNLTVHALVATFTANFGAQPLYHDDVSEVHVDSRGVAVVLLRMPGRANKINAAFGAGLAAAVARLKEQPGLVGVILASGHRDFCVGADLDFLAESRDPVALFSMVRSLSGVLRQVETLGVPVVAALGGSALGGGYELALAAHRRIALSRPDLQVGLPEVNLGVIPGAGGTQRLPRLIGLQAALEQIAQAKVNRAEDALAAGMLDQLVPDLDSLLAESHAWILANRWAKQPWDRGDFIWPGAAPQSDDARNLFMVAAAMIYQKTAGVFPAAEQAISAVQGGANLSFDRALEHEARIFVKLAVSDQAKDMVRTFWFHRTAAERHEGLPALPRGEDAGIQKVALLGAGMMGAGLAFVCASRGYDVVLKDIHQAALDAGLAHIRAEAAKVARKKGEDEAQKIVARIRATLDDAAIDGTDLVIEAVIEDMAVKHRVTRQLEPRLSANGIWASNTSALPITRLAEPSLHPERFVGLHFFSPVEKMPLLEIIAGSQTSTATLARCLDFCRRIKKLPIVVNDGYGFFTSRVFASYLMEGVQLVADGYEPVLVEWAARRAGMVVPPLQVFDEVSLRLGRHVLEQAAEWTGRSLPAATSLLMEMTDTHGRIGKIGGAGFYDYSAGSKGPKRGTIWAGLRTLARSRPGDPASVPMLSRRLLLAQCVEVGRCLDENILRTRRDAEVGAIFGIGFAPNTGGPLAWMDRQGLPALVAELDALAESEGPRFSPPETLRQMAKDGERFFER